MARAQLITDYMSQDVRTAELSRPTLSSVVRQALQLGADAMQEEFGKGQGPVPPRKARNLTAGETSVVVVRLPHTLLQRLRAQINAIHSHPQWSDRPPPTMAAVLRMALLHGLKVLAAQWLPPQLQPPIHADVALVLPIGPDSQGEPEMTSSLMNVKEVAEHLNMSTSWVYKQTAAGLLPVHRLGAALRFDRDEIAAFVAGTWMPKQGVALSVLPKAKG